MPDADRSLPLVPHHPPPPPGPGGATPSPAAAGGPAPESGSSAVPSDLEGIVRAAGRLWESIAAEAWAGYLRHGRGALLLEESELLRADAAGEDLAAAGVRPTFVPVTIVSRGDDFRGLLMRSDPERQVMLLVRRADGEEMLLTLDRSDRRPSHPACHAARGDVST